MSKVYALRCASAERIDFFEASVVRLANGEVVVKGGNVRDYSPYEVSFVHPNAYDTVNSFVLEIQQAYRSASIGGEDHELSRQRDLVSVAMTDTAFSIFPPLVKQGYMKPFYEYLEMPRAAPLSTEYLTSLATGQ
jgi:hypothetical protein